LSNLFELSSNFQDRRTHSCTICPHLTLPNATEYFGANLFGSEQVKESLSTLQRVLPHNKVLYDFPMLNG